MAHPHQSMLDEYKYALTHLVPTVPAHIKEEGMKKLTDLSANEAADEDLIRVALVETGLNEYPHRHAFHELTDEKASAKMEELVLDHLDDDVRKKVEPHIKEGATIEQYVKSEMFEMLLAEEKHQIEDGILDAKDHVREHLTEDLGEIDQKAYDKLVDKWAKHRDDLVKKINELQAMSTKDAKWKDEINDKAKRFMEGFAVTERDPDMETVEKEIEYWKGVFGELE